MFPAGPLRSRYRGAIIKVAAKCGFDFPTTSCLKVATPEWKGVSSKLASRLRLQWSVFAPHWAAHVATHMRIVCLSAPKWKTQLVHVLNATTEINPSEGQAEEDGRSLRGSYVNSRKVAWRLLLS